MPSLKAYEHRKKNISLPYTQFHCNQIEINYLGVGQSANSDSVA